MDYFRPDFIDLNWDLTLDQLATRHVAVVDDALEPALYLALKDRIQTLNQERELEKAGIGTLQHYTIQEGIRGDYIHWIDNPSPDPTEAQFLELMNEWRNRFNLELYLNSSAFEFHFAHYPAGSFYKRHLDQFKERNNRLLTFILYFNDTWKSEDQGMLRIYETGESGKETYRDIEPMGNRMILFQSDKLEHEVLPTTSPRLSLTGWFLYQPEGLSFL